MARTEYRPATIEIRADTPQEAGALADLVQQVLLGSGIDVVIDHGHANPDYSGKLALSRCDDLGEVLEPVVVSINLSYDTPYHEERKEADRIAREEAERDAEIEAARQTSGPAPGSEPEVAPWTDGEILELAERYGGPNCQHAFRYDPFGDEDDAECVFCPHRASWGDVEAGKLPQADARLEKAGPRVREIHRLNAQEVVATE